MFHEISTWVAKWIIIVLPTAILGDWVLGGDWVMFPTHSVGFSYYGGVRGMDGFALESVGYS